MHVHFDVSVNGDALNFAKLNDEMSITIADHRFHDGGVSREYCKWEQRSRGEGEVISSRLCYAYAF